MNHLAGIGVLVVLCACSPREAIESDNAPFLDVARSSGLHFHHSNGANGDFHLPEIMGSGAGLIDYDADGDLDVYLVQGEPAAGGNRLFRNDIVPTGRLHFTDVTAETGAGHSGWGMGVSVGDYDGDGDEDLLVTNYGANVLYRNDGGRFTDVSQVAGIESDGWHTSAAFIDYDRDNDLDLYVCKYVDFSFENPKTCRGTAGSLDYCTPKAYRPVIDCLFRNQGNGTFRDVTAASGIGNEAGAGLGVAAADFDGDGWTDLYVANDADPNHLWINRHDGTFRNDALLAGLAFSEDGQPQAGMGLAITDYDADGKDDVVVTNLTREGATLYRNEGGGLFTDVSGQTRLRNLTLPYTGFGTGWLDYDVDGRQDLLIVNGAVTVIDAQRGKPQPFRQPAQLLRNAGGRFEPGPLLELEGVNRGAAFGDLDNDGDVDVVVTSNGGPARLLSNTSEIGDDWLVVRLAGGQWMGGRVAVVCSGSAPVWRRYSTDGSYLSAGDPAVHFRLAGSDRVEAVLVNWPDGSTERWETKARNTVHTVRKGTGIPVPGGST